MAEAVPLTETRTPLLRRREVAADTVELTFDFSSAPAEFTAGQYVSLIASPELGIEPPSDQRDLSITSSPELSAEVSVAYRESDSPVKDWLRELKPGSEVTLRGPAGSFTLPDGADADAPVAMVAGGIGVAPFRSMLLDPGQASRRIGLFCWNDAPERLPYAEELRKLTSMPSRRLVAETGRFRADSLGPWHRAHPDSYWYVAGPSEMVWSVLAALDKLGVPRERVRTEEFTGYEDRPES